MTAWRGDRDKVANWSTVIQSTKDRTNNSTNGLTSIRLAAVQVHGKQESAGVVQSIGVCKSHHGMRVGVVRMSVKSF